MASARLALSQVQQPNMVPSRGDIIGDEAKRMTFKMHVCI